MAALQGARTLAHTEEPVTLVKSPAEPPPAGPVPWISMIHKPGDPAFPPVVAQQWTRPNASPAEIADERMAAHLHPYACADRLAEASGLVGKVWRADDPGWSGEARADDWPGVKDGRRLDRWAVARRNRPAA